MLVPFDQQQQTSAW